MAYELIFQSTERSDVSTNLIVRCNQFNEIYIEIANPASHQEFNFQFICLEKQSAIKLAKELRKQISFMED
jgi:alpha-D-ribose 1-methylphosphonate 5-triphosphate synthase subunit PhnI